LLPLMLAEGHVVAAMTRTPEKIDGLRTAGATPVLCDVLDRKSVIAAVEAFRPDVIVHQVTNLPDEIDKLAELLASNSRVRNEGARNLLAAAQAVNVLGFIAQSIAWGDGEAHENAVLAAGGTVLRYGRFYGPGTYYQNDLPPAPRIHIDEAARRTMPFLAGPSGIFVITDATSADDVDISENALHVADVDAA
jgi:uncharacterized protein YbjT (DUF2867 family)